jgi:polyhydroxyalkanoate synthesis regulator phasin
MNKKLVAGLAAVGVLAGGGTAAALITAGGAAPATASTVTTVSTTATVPVGSPLASLVAKGTITQSQATAIQNALITYLREHRLDMGARCAGSWSDGMPMLASHGPLKTVLGQLVKNGTITQAQASAVTSAFTQQIRAHWGNGPGMRGYGPGMMGGYGPGMMGAPHMGWAN